MSPASSVSKNHIEGYVFRKNSLHLLDMFRVPKWQQEIFFPCGNPTEETCIFHFIPENIAH